VSTTAGPASVAAEPLTVVGVDASPVGGSRTAAAIETVLEASTGAGVVRSQFGVGDASAADLENAVAALAGADAVVLGSPVYRGTFAWPLKRLLDAIPRDPGPAPGSPLSGKAVAIVFTGASLHHFLAPADLRDLLTGFFAAYVVPPGLYVPRDGFEDDLTLREPYRSHAWSQGEALVALAQALSTTPELRGVRPQA
jgi:FMN reductase